MATNEQQTRLIGRRDALQMAAGTLALAAMGLGQKRTWAARAGSIVLTPEETEGPYFVEEHLNRSDLRVDPTDKSVQAGHPLNLAIAVSQLHAGKLTPLPNATVDIWHCSALGYYSDVAQQGTVGRKYLRGSQATDKAGAARFTTIYPGWYNGRTVHIHAKLRLFDGNKTTYEFNTQMFFDDKATDKVYSLAPYSRRGPREVRNADDGIFGGADPNAKGAKLMLALADSSSAAAGKFNIIVDLSHKPMGERGFGPGGPAGPGDRRGFGPPPGGPGGFGPPPPGFGPPPGF